MSSKQKNKEEDSRPNPGTGSKSLVQFFQKLIRRLKPSDARSKADAKQQERNPRGSVGVGGSATFHEDPQHPSSSAPLSLSHSAPQTSTTISTGQHPSSSAPLSLSHSVPQTSTTISTSQHQPLSTVTSGPQTRHVESNNLVCVGDDNRGNVGIIGHKGINFLVQQFYDNSRAGERSMAIKLSSVIIAVIFIEATQQVLGALFGDVIASSTTESEKNSSEENIVEQNFHLLIKSVNSAMERGDSSIRQAPRDYLKDLWSELCRGREQLSNTDNNPMDIEILSLDIACKLRRFLFLNHMGGYIPPAIVIEWVKKRMVKLLTDAEAAAPWQIKDLPCEKTAYDEYVSSHRRRVSCFEGTRQALLEEMGCWVAKAETGIFVLFGLAGIGKSTIAQTVAERADNVRLLGASFFFSRDEAERRTAERFFTTVASQLCVHDPEFASAIESVLTTRQGKNAIRKFPLDQLETFILKPLRALTPRKVLIVVDALDECDAKDIPAVLIGLNKLVQVLPSFKVILTTRPQKHLQLFRNRLESQKVLDLHDIEDKIVDGDIERYLRHKLSLEEVKACLPNLREPWAASDDEIESLVGAAGRLFIIASTAVLFILDETSTPEKRMKLLLNALENGHTPFKALNSFYSTILRSAVPEGSDNDTRDCYQTVVGAIILIQQPLTVPALAKLINVECWVTYNLSSYFPLTYHKSFPDFIQDPARCTNEDLRIDPRMHHTRMATYCLRLLNQHLKQNILGLSDPARFMDNDEALVKQGLTENHIQEKIPAELQYACLYFASHMESADVEDVGLVEELEQFFNNRLLNWFEALSWIRKLDSAHRTLLQVQTQLKPGSSDLIADALRFICKFYQIIERSALHTYHSALPFTPTKTCLYEKYSDQMTFCQVSGGQERWDEVIATVELGSSNTVEHVEFSSDGALFACCVVEREETKERNGSITIHDAVAGITVGRVDGWIFTITNDFSKAAAYHDGSITVFNVKDFTPVATIRPPATVVKLNLSPDGTRLVVGLDNATVFLWDTEKCEQIKNFDGWKAGQWRAIPWIYKSWMDGWTGRWEFSELMHGQRKDGIAFSSDGCRIAFASDDEVVKVLDGTSGKIVADLEFPGLQQSTLMFSGDGSRLACLSARSLRVWNVQDGALIGAAEDVGVSMAISTDGSRLVTSLNEPWSKVKLFSGNSLTLLKTLDIDLPVESLAIQNDIFGAASCNKDFVILYDINSYRCITWLPFMQPTALAFSHDCTRLAVGNYAGEVRLWDVPSIISQRRFTFDDIRSLAFSPDCSRLASGHKYGTVKLWDTVNMAEVARSSHSHDVKVELVAFSADGENFASGSLMDKTIILWGGKDGTPRGVLKCSGWIQAIALSSIMVAASMATTITLWDLKSHSVIATVDQPSTVLLTFSHLGPLLAAADSDSRLTLWNTETHERVTTFQHTSRRPRVHRMAFLPDDSRIAVQNCLANDMGGYDLSDEDDEFYLSNVHEGEASKFQASENEISRLSLCTSWHGIPVWSRGSGNIVGRFPQQKDAVTVLYCPSDFDVRKVVEGSSMIALGCANGRILLVKAT